MENQAPTTTLSSQNQGVFIALEGLANDQAELLKRLHAELVAANVPAKLLPTLSNHNNLTAQTLAVVLEDARYPKTPRVRSLLDTTALASQYEAVEATITTGTHCLLNQSALSELVTNYYGLGITNDYATISTLVDFATAKKAPSLTLVFDTPVSELTSQTIKNLSLPVPAEQQNSFLERIRAGYLWEANHRNLPVIFASSDINATFAQVWGHVAELLQLSSTKSTVDRPQSVAEVLATRPPQKTAPFEPPQTLLPNQQANDTSVQPHTPAQTEQSPQAATPTPKTPTAQTITASSLLVSSLQPHPSVVDAEIPFEQKNADGHYRYYIPAELKGKVRSQYIRTMNQLFENYSTIKTAVQTHLEKSSTTRDAVTMSSLQYVLPLAATFNIQLPAGSFTIPKETLSEAIAVGLAHEQTSHKEASIQTEIDELLPPNYTALGQAVQLVRYTPRNELELTIDVVYPRSDLSFDVLEDTVGAWTYEQKVNILTAGLQTSRAEALANAQYTFDITNPYATVQVLHSQVSPVASTHQPYSPRLGYDVPKIIEEAGMTDVYEQCFDLSLELHSAVYAAKGATLAQYAVLHGHNVREKLTLSANQMLGLFTETARQNTPTLQQLVRQLNEQITEVHPLLAGSMTIPQ